MSKPKKGNKFVYSLETLKKYRDIKEKKQQEELIKAEQVVKEEQQKEIEFVAEQNNHYAYFEDILASDEIPSLDIIQMNQVHMKKLQEKVNTQKEEVKKAEEHKDEQKEKLVEATKEKKIIDKDREKTREKWKKMMDKLDAQFLDELGTIKFARKKIEDAAEKQGKSKYKE
ncbi:MAG: hypothetical protein CMP39_02450 [Rickettsiales bacterium]|nr:hypothetical protein [Rickettsiales bacterium]